MMIKIEKSVQGTIGFQGLCGGPLMPLSQTLLMRFFRKEKPQLRLLCGQ